MPARQPIVETPHGPCSSTLLCHVRGFSAPTAPVVQLVQPRARLR